MEELPDNVLVMVMQYLDIPDVLKCRQLCTRLRDLAVLPNVWQHRTLRFADPWPCPVLRLAPCLDMLEVALRPTNICDVSYTSTRCAVKVLHLYILDSTDNVDSSALLVCKQEALGRLRRVHATLHTVRNASMLLATLASTTGLESLTVSSIDSPLSAADTTATVLHSTVSGPSLKRLDCYCCSASISMGLKPFVNAMLAGHAATLEVVKLGAITTSTAALLANMPHLSELSCRCCLPGMEAVATSESLRVLSLTIRTTPKYQSAAAAAAKLLLDAKHLREVTLAYSPAISSNTDVGADLVLNLASSPSGPRVEKLRIGNDNDGGFPQIYPLICALPRLSALRHLDLESGLVPTDYLLMAITPATAPALELVKVSLAKTKCAHAWLHGRAINSVMAAKPSLHIKLRVELVYCDQDSCEGGCVLSCHKGLSDPPERSEEYLGIFSHGAEDKCSQDHTDKDCLWIHFP